jgi:hypothetical protein
MTRSAIEMADKLDALKRQAAAIAVGIVAIEDMPHKHAIGGLTDLAFDLSDKLCKLSEEVHETKGGERWTRKRRK